MENLIVLANLGRLRFLKLHKAGDDPQDKTHLREEPGSPFIMKPKNIHEIVTDSAGRFTRGGPVGQASGMSYGEEHELEAEIQHKALERIAGKISEMVAAEGYPYWRLITAKSILHSLQAALPAPVRDVLSHSEPADLTKLPLADIEKRLLNGH